MASYSGFRFWPPSGVLFSRVAIAASWRLPNAGIRGTSHKTGRLRARKPMQDETPLAGPAIALPNVPLRQQEELALILLQHMFQFGGLLDLEGHIVAMNAPVLKSTAV
jgi:hypothetical protein